MNEKSLIYFHKHKWAWSKQFWVEYYTLYYMTCKFKISDQQKRFIYYSWICFWSNRGRQAGFVVRKWKEFPSTHPFSSFPEKGRMSNETSFTTVHVKKTVTLKTYKIL